MAVLVVAVGLAAMAFALLGQRPHPGNGRIRKAERTIGSHGQRRHVRWPAPPWWGGLGIRQYSWAAAILALLVLEAALAAVVLAVR